MRETEFQLTVLGARGSMARDGQDCAEFGGDTSCYMLRAGEETLFLDAGSGLISAPAQYPKDPVILLSHLHLDHLIGLGMFPGISNRAHRPRIYVPFCEDRSGAEAILDRLYAPPFWPLKLGQLESHPELLPMPQRLQLGDLTVETMPGNHPGDCLMFRICFHGKSLVYATDFEHGEEASARLSDFARDADLLLYDAQYAECEYEACRGFGHSTARNGLEIMERVGVKRLLLIHHAPWSSDTILRERESRLPEGASYARQGQVISI